MIRLKQFLFFYNKAIFLVLLMMAAGFISGCARPEISEPAQQEFQPGMPAAVSVSSLQPGLSVIYFHDKYRHIKKMPEGKRIEKYAHPGPPVLKLDHKFERGKVFDSGRSQEVGMFMTGYFLLEKQGKYRFQSNSNDGFRMFINGNVVVDDPTVHVDKLSDPGQFEVKKGGLFPVTLKYFQRKGTATLQLFWQPPGSSSFVIVPETAYFHKP